MEEKIIITIKKQESDLGNFFEITLAKPKGMSLVEVMGYIEMTKQDLYKNSLVIEELEE